MRRSGRGDLSTLKREDSRAPRDPGVAGRMAAALESAGRLEEALAWREYEVMLITLSASSSADRLREIRDSLQDDERERLDAAVAAVLHRGRGISTRIRGRLRHLIEEAVRLDDQRPSLNEAWRAVAGLRERLGLWVKGTVQRPDAPPTPESSMESLDAMREIARGSWTVAEVETDEWGGPFKEGDQVRIMRDGRTGTIWETRNFEPGSGVWVAMDDGSMLDLAERDLAMVQRAPTAWTGTFRGATTHVELKVNRRGVVVGAMAWMLHGLPYAIRAPLPTVLGVQRHATPALLGTAGTCTASVGIRYGTIRKPDGSIRQVKFAFDCFFDAVHGDRRRGVRKVVWQDLHQSPFAGPEWLLTRLWLTGRMLDPMAPEDAAAVERWTPRRWTRAEW